MRNIFSGDYLFVAGQTSPEDALSAGNYPASASYIDVTGYEWVNVIVHLGAIDASDTPGLELKQADAVDGTLDVIDATNCVHECAADDDDEIVTFYLETANLATDHHFISLVVADVTNGSYADILFILGGARRQPVTQTTALLPAASQHIHAG